MGMRECAARVETKKESEGCRRWSTQGGDGGRGCDGRRWRDRMTERGDGDVVSCAWRCDGEGGDEVVERLDDDKEGDDREMVAVRGNLLRGEERDSG